jgi:bifunctional DNA-binding transcriptional regulator/antitoxin component of YhaV-PrlF toxin-antitoxin module
MKHRYVTMNSQGRITLTAATRKALGLIGDDQFIEEVRDGEIVLRPTVSVERADAWAYTPEHREAVRVAQTQTPVRLTEAELVDLIDKASA